MLQATARASVTGKTITPIVRIAKTLKQASSPITAQATPALLRLACRHSAHPVTTAAANGAPATSRAPHPFAPTRVADPAVTVPELDELIEAVDD